MTATTAPSQRRRLAQRAIFGFILLIGLVAVGKMGCNRFIEKAMRPYCANNMRQIALGVIMYANSHGGQFPDDLVTLFENQDLGTGVWFCIAASDGVGQSPKELQQARAEIQSGKIDYLWLGKGVTVSSPNDVVVLYERPENHSGRGMNVAFADAHIEWLGPDDVTALLQKIATGQRPVRFQSRESPTKQP